MTRIGHNKYSPGFTGIGDVYGTFIFFFSHNLLETYTSGRVSTTGRVLTNFRALPRLLPGIRNDRTVATLGKQINKNSKYEARGTAVHDYKYLSTPLFLLLHFLSTSLSPHQRPELFKRATRLSSVYLRN